MNIETRVNNRIAKIAARVRSSNNLNQALAAGAAQLQREIMMQALSMDIIDTGNLINSHTRRRAGAYGWWIISPAAYSVYVHMGTKRMPARPWMELGTTKAMPGIIAMIERAVEKDLKA